MIPELNAAWVLHYRPYKETSVIAEFLVKEYGRIAMVVKGARKRKSLKASLLQPFTQVMVSWRGKGELKTLCAVEPVVAIKLRGDNLYCGFYVNELVLRSQLPCQPIEGLFDLYTFIISQLDSSVPIQPILRFFEIQLMFHTGYLPAFDVDAKSGQPIVRDNLYVFQPAVGFTEVNPAKAHVYDKLATFSGEVVHALANGDFCDESYYSDFKRFTRLALTVVIGDRPLKSRDLFKKILR